MTEKANQASMEEGTIEPARQNIEENSIDVPNAKKTDGTSQSTVEASQAEADRKFERFKYFVELTKWFIVSVALVIVTLIIDSGFRDRSAGIQEIQQYDKYVTDLIVLNKEIGPRRLLAQYFANVTASDKLRDRWKAYYIKLDKEYKNYVAQDSIVKHELQKITEKIADSFKVSKVEKSTLRNLQQKSIDLDRQLNATIKTPLTPNVTLNSASITFITGRDDKDADTDITIILRSTNGTILSTTNFYHGVQFEDASIHTFPMSGFINQINKTDIMNGKLEIHIIPNGHDTWEFTPAILFKLSDGTEINQNHFPLVRLDQNKNTISLSF